MNDNDLREALAEGRVFHVDDSFIFAVQIPDNAVGVSGSRCSNCKCKAAYSMQRCVCCGLPFIGPVGFPLLPEWEEFSLEMKKSYVDDVYFHGRNMGRITPQNVKSIPLNPEQLKEIEKMSGDQANLFKSAHAISVNDIRKALIMQLA